MFQYFYKPHTPGADIRGDKTASRPHPTRKGRRSIPAGALIAIPCETQFTDVAPPQGAEKIYLYDAIRFFGMPAVHEARAAARETARQ